MAADGKAAPPNLYDINGSANFFNKTDFGLTIYRGRAEDSVSVEVHKVKFKHLSGCGVAKFEYNYNNGRYVPIVGDRALEWNYDNFLTQNKKQQLKIAQTVLDLDTQSPEEMEQRFLSDTTPDDMLPF